MSQSIRRKILSRQKVFGTTISYLHWNGLMEVMKNEILDFVLFDYEHGCFSVETLEESLRACRLLDIPSIVRAADTEYHLISHLFDIGAGGVLVPRVETAEQALRVREYVRFPPLGKKGCGGFALLKASERIEDFNAAKVILFQIETPLGIQNLIDILQTGDCDGIIVGPTDLSISLGIPLDYRNATLIEAIETVIATCRDREVSCGVYCDTHEEIRFWRSRGVNLIWAGGDVGYFRKAYNEMCDFVSELD